MPISKASGQAVAPAAKGDLIVGSATNDAAVLAVGSTDQVLTVDSSTTTGLKWAAIPSSSQSWSQVGSTVTIGANSSVTVSGITGADKLMINLVNCSSATTGGWFSIHINNDTTANRYYHFGLSLKSNATYSTGVFDQFNEGNSVPTTGIHCGLLGAASKYMAATVFINGGNSSGIKTFQGQSGVGDTLNSNKMGVFGGYYNQTATISSISVKYNAGANNFSDGVLYVWKSA